MKHVIAIVLMMICAAAALAADDPGKIDVMDGSMDQPSRIQIDGELTENSPVFNRWRPNDYQAVSVDCMLPMEYNYTAQPPYDMYCFNVSTADPVEFEVTEVASGLDTVVYIYCDPFDPNAAQDNAVIFDDDDGDGLQSYIQASDNVTLVPGNDYWFVICGYNDSDFGTYVVQTSDNVALCGTVANEETTWSNVKGLFD
jgi:hypothetical protein